MKATGLSKDARGFVDSVVTYLKSDGRGVSAAPKVERMIDKVSKSAKREYACFVESSIALDDEEKQTIAKEMSTLVGHDVTVENTIRKELIAGLCIRIGDVIIDTSFKRKLDEMALQCVTA